MVWRVIVARSRVCVVVLVVCLCMNVSRLVSCGGWCWCSGVYMYICIYVYNALVACVVVVWWSARVYIDRYI